jgi:hypothetical protein
MARHRMFMRLNEMDGQPTMGEHRPGTTVRNGPLEVWRGLYWLCLRLYLPLELNKRHATTILSFTGDLQERRDIHLMRKRLHSGRRQFRF